MADSDTTRVQKRILFSEIQLWVSYLETHGLECINLMDLQDAERALNKVDTGTRHG